MFDSYLIASYNFFFWIDIKEYLAHILKRIYWEDYK